MRTACELLGQMFSLALDARLRDAEKAQRQRGDDLHRKVLRFVAASEPLMPQLAALSDDLMAAMGATGIGAIIDNEVRLWGDTPDRKAVDGIVEFLNGRTSADVFATDALASLYPPAAASVAVAAGVVAIPISRRLRDYLLFFRPELVRTVTWAGNPEKPVETTATGSRLTPRKSFEAWQQQARGMSAPWDADVLQRADMLRLTLIEVLLKHTEAIAGERRQAQERQQVLIGELNHRVRNIFGLIRGLINQVHQPERSAKDFIAAFDERVRALARAHDQLTSSDGGAASLHQLIANETAAYLGDRADAAVVSGDDVGLTPTAFSSLALVIHELTTNSAKYGALRQPGGRILIDLSRDDDAMLVLDWRERGGPEVESPRRRGFGTTVIERTVTHDLGGEVALHYAPEGFSAHFTVAPEHLTDPALTDELPPEPRQLPAEPVALTGPALIVEDSVIIAMDAEAMLNDLGCDQVVLCSNLRQARAAIEREGFRFAILDVNLGSQTSFPIADLCRQHGVPYVFATGYSDGVNFPAEHAGAPRLSKPIDPARIAAAVTAALSASND